ncbi:unnamed protein product [Notodromas monacha]|uniref:Hexosyltransferase n=1 Tax=Notodromas monacha TaxID=399045 RepID=A0A7R9BYU6_9CRUS|nr:unnamed protein product [Notodromas monacha]CAG0922818.1 unnamed protein product [Notodromas monacha]
MKLISWIRPKSPKLLQLTDAPRRRCRHLPSSLASALPTTAKQTRYLLAVVVVTLLALGFMFELSSLVTSAVDSSRRGPEPIITETTLRIVDYLQRPEACRRHADRTFAVVVVTSHPGNRVQRDTWRENSPAKELADIGLRRVFLLGRINPKQTGYLQANQTSIDDEIELHGDIVQGDFQEAYKNLTLKHLMGLHWAATNCPGASYVIKMDDDIAVDFYQLATRLHTRRPTNSLLGLLQLQLDVVRNPGSKWFVPDDEYSAGTYPNFLSGWAYAASMDAVKDIVSLTTNVNHTFFWIDDVLVTGILAEELGIKRESLTSYYSVYKKPVAARQHAEKAPRATSAAAGRRFQKRGEGRDIRPPMFAQTPRKGDS